MLWDCLPPNRRPSHLVIATHLQTPCNPRNIQNAPTTREIRTIRPLEPLNSLTAPLHPAHTSSYRRNRSPTHTTHPSSRITPHNASLPPRHAGVMRTDDRSTSCGIQPSFERRRNDWGIQPSKTDKQGRNPPSGKEEGSPSASRSSA